MWLGFGDGVLGCWGVRIGVVRVRLCRVVEETWKLEVRRCRRRGSRSILGIRVSCI